MVPAIALSIGGSDISHAKQSGVIWIVPCRDVTTYELFM